MGIRRGSISTPIIADGLVYNIDAANRASYPVQRTLTTAESGSCYNTLDLNQSGSFISDPQFITQPVSASCWEFDGVDDYIDVTTISLGTTQTLSWWIYRNSYLTQEAPFGDTTSGLSDMLVYMNGLTLYYRVGATNLIWTSALSSALTNQKWCNIVITRDGAINKAYLNGDFVSTQTLSGGNESSVVQLDTIGASAASSPTFLVNGNIANVQMYNRELSANEVLHNYNALKGRFA